MNEIYTKLGVRAALVDYYEFRIIGIAADLQDMTNDLYDVLDEALEHCGLTEREQCVISAMYTDETTDGTLASTAHSLGISEKAVERTIDRSVDKIHAYMNGVNE